MTTPSADSSSASAATCNLAQARCVPCEGNVPRLSPEEASQLLRQLPGWQILSEPDRLRKSWTVQHFQAAMEFFQAVADLAEREGHHPDLHLTAFRNVSIDIWTHAIQGLSVNDFILAARIDELPVRLKS